MKIEPDSNNATGRERKMLPSVNSDAMGCPKQPRPGGRRAGARGRRGGSLVEFTLVMPVLLLVTTGMAAFGFVLHNELVLTNAVNNGAQQLAFSRGQTSDPCATAYAAISGAAPSLTSGLSLTFVINGVTYSSTTTCTGGAANMVQGASAQITATYPCALGVFRGSYSCSLGTQTTEFIQ
jgi:Flp pilus assembly protein TadG